MRCSARVAATWVWIFLTLLSVGWTTLPSAADGASLPARGQRAEATEPDSSTVPWTDPEGRPLPFRSEDEVVDFLLHADVVSSREFGEGITGLLQLVLERDGVRARAAFHHIDETKRHQRMDSGYFRIYYDSYRGQCAAYAVARLLGLGNVPPVVCRSIDGTDGSLQLWVEDALLEADRAERGLEPPVAREWLRQLHAMRLLDLLIYNDDRHARNYLYDSDWRLWLIDHTRSFQANRSLPEAPPILCERRVWERLQSITPEQLRDAVRDYLRPVQMDALVRRHELLIEHMQGLIAERGEGAVLLDDPCVAGHC